MKATIITRGYEQVGTRSESLLEVCDLRIWASTPSGPQTLVEDVSFSLYDSQTIGIVGESGSGKSMTARSIVGLLPLGVYSAGEIRLEGRPLAGLSERRLRQVRGRRIALLMQDPFTMLNPLRTVGGHLAESLTRGARGRREMGLEIDRRLAEVGLDGQAVIQRYPFQLSGGMLQRVALACALAKDPDILIADEPTTALDATVQADVLALLRSIQRSRGMAMVLVTHDLRVAQSACERLMVMYAGRVVEAGPTDQVRSSPLHPYTGALIRSELPMDGVRGHLHSIPGRVPTPDSVRGRCSFAARCEWVQDVCVSAPTPLLQRAAEPGPGNNVARHTHLTACVRAPEIAKRLPSVRAQGDSSAAKPRIPPANNLLQVTGLRKTFVSGRLFGRSRTADAISDVSFSVAEGESVGLVGESGSGKTTIARCLLGLDTPSAGRIVLDDIDISDFRTISSPELKRVRHTIQCVFQDPFASLNPSRTVASALEEALSAAGVAESSSGAAELLELVGLPADYANRYPVALSGGECQRVAFARAVAGSPKLLVCDEPVAALDVSAQAQLLELLRELQQRLSLSTVFISHDLAVVRQVTDRVIVLHDGEIVESGDTGTVLRDPKHEYTRRLVDSVDAL